MILEMSRNAFNGFMSVDVDCTSAAMSGELTFSGDISAAMGLQALQEDLTRMYQEARA